MKTYSILMHTEFDGCKPTSEIIYTAISEYYASEKLQARFAEELAIPRWSTEDGDEIEVIKERHKMSIYNPQSGDFIEFTIVPQTVDGIDSFPVVSLSREDFERFNCDASKVPDNIMEWVAQKMGNNEGTMEQFWVSLECAIENLDIDGLIDGNETEEDEQP